MCWLLALFIRNEIMNEFPLDELYKNWPLHSHQFQWTKMRQKVILFETCLMSISYWLQKTLLSSLMFLCQMCCCSMGLFTFTLVKHLLRWPEVRWLTWPVKNIALYVPKNSLVYCKFRFIIVFHTVTHPIEMWLSSSILTAWSPNFNLPQCTITHALCWGQNYTKCATVHIVMDCTLYVIDNRHGQSDTRCEG